MTPESPRALARHRAWYAANKERHKANQRARYQANREAITARVRAHYWADPHKHTAMKRAYARTAAGMLTQVRRSAKERKA